MAGNADTREKFLKEGASLSDLLGGHVVSDTPKEDLASLKDLAKTKGFDVLIRILNENILEAALFLSDPGLNGYQASIDFQRGMIHATSQLQKLLDIRIRRLEEQIIMEEMAKSDTGRMTNG